MNNISHQKLVDSNEQEFAKIFKNGKPGVYIGFDPTAESIHLGNYMGLLALTHFRLAGFQPIVLFGGATGLIGDPSGKSAERTLLSEEVIAANVRSFRSQFERLDKNLREATGTNDLPETKYINNLDFYKDISAIGLLRDIGKHFRVT